MSKNGELIVIADAVGRILSFNSECEDLTGFSEQEVLGKSILDHLVPGNWRDVVLARFAAETAMDVREPHCNPWLTKKGEERMIEWSCDFMPSESGRLVLGRGYVCDGNGNSRASERPSWKKVRMISFDGPKISLMMEGETEPRVYPFKSYAEMETQLRRWFGSM